MGNIFDTLETVSLVSYILAILFFLVAVMLFFVFQVPKLFGDISGANAKKAIENIRKQNEQTGNKAYKPSAVNMERGKLTAKISPSGNLENTGTQTAFTSQTEKIGENNMLPSSETVVLDQVSSSGETVVLDQISNEGETVVLDNVHQSEYESAQTTVLSENMIENGVQNVEESITDESVYLDVDIGFSQSAEIIE